MKKYFFVVSAMFLQIFAGSAHALDVQIHGFGTAGFAKTDSKFVVNDLNNDTSRLLFTRDNRFGFNISALVSDRWDISSQFITKASSFDPISAQYFFARYHLSSEFTVRAGRMIAPTWVFSEQIEVGLTYPWVRLPYEVYNLNPLRSYDGASVTWSHPIGDWNLVFEVEAGTTSYKEKSFDETKLIQDSIPESFGANIVLTDDKHSFIRLSYGNAVINGNVTINTTTSTSTPLGFVNASTTTTTFNYDRVQLFSVGGKFDIGKFLLIGEAARRIITSNYLNGASAAYGTIGYHIGDWMPFVSGAWLGSLSGSGWYDPDTSTMTSAITSFAPLDNQLTISGGLNYRISPNVMWKLQYDNVRTNNTVASYSKNAQVISSSLDFVF